MMLPLWFMILALIIAGAVALVLAGIIKFDKDTGIINRVIYKKYKVKHKALYLFIPIISILLTLLLVELYGHLLMGVVPDQRCQPIRLKPLIAWIGSLIIFMTCIFSWSAPLGCLDD